MTDVAALLEVFALDCCRCGKPGAGAFEDPAAAAAVLTVRPLPPNGGAVRMEPFGLAQVDPASLAAARPVHRRCLPGGPGRVMAGIGFGGDG